MMVDSVSVVLVGLGHQVISGDLRVALTALSNSMGHVEIAVVENASDERDSNQGPDSIITNRISFADNRGYAVAVNSGVASTTGEVVIVMTSDALPAPDALVRLAEAMHRNNDIGVVGPRLDVGDEQWFGGTWSRPWGWARHRMTPGPTDPEWLDGACLCIRRQAFDAVGGFNEGTFLYGEDLLLCRQIAQQPQRIVVLPDVGVSQTSGMFKRSGAHAYLVSRNEVLVARLTGARWSTVACALTGVARGGLELARVITRSSQRQHHARQSVGFVWGAVDGLRRRMGRPPERLCRWAEIPQ